MYAQKNAKITSKHNIKIKYTFIYKRLLKTLSLQFFVKTNPDQSYSFASGLIRIRKTASVTSKSTVCYLQHDENLQGKYVDTTVDQGGNIGGWFFHIVQDTEIIIS